MTPEDEAILDRVWDQIGREEPGRARFSLGGLVSFATAVAERRRSRNGKTTRRPRGARAATGGGNCGTGSGGFQPGNTCGRPGAGSGAEPAPTGGPGGARPVVQAKHQPAGKPRVQEGQPSDRVLRARAAAGRVATKNEQNYAKANEFMFADKLGGSAMPDNEPVDVLYQDPKNPSVLHGIELKTIVNGQNDKITMKGDALARKAEWLKRKKPSNLEEAAQGSKIDWSKVKRRVIHTVVLDHRHLFADGANKQYYSGHEVWYRNGVGSFRVKGMDKVQSLNELKKTLAKAKK